MLRLGNVHLILLLVNLIYGANYTIAKAAMPFFIKPYGFILIRVASASILFAFIQVFFIKEKVAAKDHLLLFLCGFFGVALNQLMFFKGLSLTTPINAALMMITTPIIVLLLSAFKKLEKLSLLKMAGIFAGASGAGIIIMGGQKLQEGVFLSGDIFVLINAASYAVYLILAKPLMRKYHPITIITWTFLFGLIIVAPVGWEELMEVQWNDLPFNIWLSILYVVIATTFIAYMLNIIALAKANPSVVGSYIYLQPFIAAVIALALGKEEITLLKIAASILIFAGVYLVSKKSEKFMPEISA